MKIVINVCNGGFDLSAEAKKYLGKEWDSYYCLWDDDYKKRNDPRLVKCVEKLKEKANTRFSKLRIIEIPDSVNWTIEECDGNEWIAEKHKIWR